MENPQEEKKEYYQPTIWDGIGAVIVLSLAWYFDAETYVSSITDPIVLGLLDLVGLG